MSHDSSTNVKQTVVVMATAEEWSSFKSLLQDSSGDERHQVTFSSLGSIQVCNLAVRGRLIDIHYADLKEDMAQEGVSRAINGCFKSCTGGIISFLLLIRGGYYAKRERRIIEILQAEFGPEALRYLVILSLEDGEVADTLDDSLLELIHTCDGRYCRLTSSSAADKMHALLEVIDNMLAGDGATGYTQATLAEARRRVADDSAMKMLQRKVQEAEERERALEQLVLQQEERRAREMDELKAEHAEERRKEAAEKERYEAKRESLEEAVRSHRDMLQLHMSATGDDETKKRSVILLGLSGSGKSSALNLILGRACNRYSVDESSLEAPRPTLACERRAVLAAGGQLVLVDTPELWDEDGAETPELVKDCLALALPGPHAFLLVLQVGRFTQGESDMLGRLQKIFGRDFSEHAVVLFVRLGGEQRGPQRINDYVAGAPPALRDLVRKCGSRYYELSVTKSQNALGYPQVKDLLSGVNKLIASHGGRSYSVRRFSEQELQERKKVIEESKEGRMEVNYLLRET
ncbi:GTPase IMAP family member 8-like [Scophthalmus maximus]|uniref:AIG1-type G domain-containing protein n=1 Tax=Scophthalmus maximus TaxID=52904 RepID=A0A8D3A1T7_SCOMX|nr:GTPase IMAP family member 8-like [Scophthalmus maximus]XP_035465313.1 GTPase IMAP family member 8-like [Scophthalmus maximus]XP_035465314.1 GTPase IMAP family member 8-like [Scophthalmus maximus]